MDRRKELKELYKAMKPDMGVFIICNNSNNKSYIEATQDLKGTMNSTRFKLNANSHINKELQKDWTDKGEDNFTIEIVENLKYDKDESKTDYKDELAILKMICEERLQKQDVELY